MVLITFIFKRFLLILFGLVLILGSSQMVAASELIESLRDHPATLRTEKLSVPLLLRGLGRQGDINIFVPASIEGEISLDLRDSTLYEIFQLVIKAQDLHYTEQNNTVIIETLADYLKSGRGIVTERICTDFGNGKEIQGQLETLLSDRGSISVTSNDSCLIIKDRQENLKKIKVMLAEIDVPIPQIHIESRIIVISKEGRDRLGVKWGMSSTGDDIFGATTGTISGLTDLSVEAATTTIGLGLVWDNLTLDLEIQALQEEDILQVLAAPALLVLDGQKALIKHGKEVPYTSQSGDSLNTEFREAVLSLEVTPKITKNTFINLDVIVTNDSVDQTNDVNGEPLINRQEITTSLFLENKTTVVIGGIHVSGDDLDITKVHWLADIPFIGGLFKSRSKATGNYELMIFLTPTIVSMATLTEESEKAQKKIDEALSTNVHKKFKPEVYLMPDSPDPAEADVDETNTDQNQQKAKTDQEISTTNPQEEEKN